MEQIKKEAILFLSKMAERRINNNLLHIDQLHQYTSIIQHISGVKVLTPISEVNNILKYIDLDLFKDYPNLQDELKGLVKQVEASL